MKPSQKKKEETLISSPNVNQLDYNNEYDSDTSDIDFLGKAITFILLIIQVAWLIVISPALYNTLFPKY